MASKEDSANAVIIGFLSTRTSGDIAFFWVFKASRKFTESKGRRKVNEVRGAHRNFVKDKVYVCQHLVFYFLYFQCQSLPKKQIVLDNSSDLPYPAYALQHTLP